MSEPCNEEGNYKGDCCCRCKFQCEIEGHPWNDEPYKKNGSGEILGYGCAAFYAAHRILGVEGMQAPSAIGTVTFMHTRKHSMCEMFTERD